MNDISVQKKVNKYYKEFRIFCIFVVGTGVDDSLNQFNPYLIPHLVFFPGDNVERCSNKNKLKSNYFRFEASF